MLKIEKKNPTDFIKEKIKNFESTPKKLIFNFSFFNEFLNEVKPQRRYCLRCKKYELECKCINPNIINAPLFKIYNLLYEISSLVDKSEKVVVK